MKLSQKMARLGTGAAFQVLAKAQALERIEKATAKFA